MRNGYRAPSPAGKLCFGDSGILVSQPSPLGKGDRAAVDRVLSLTAYLRRSPSLFFIPLVPYPVRFARPLPHAGKGDRVSGARVLSQTAHLRRSFPLFFIPLVPYPARFARHLPHAGKALSVGIVFPHMRIFVLIMREKRHSLFAAFTMQGKRCYPCAIIHNQHCPYEGKPKRRRKHPAPL